MTVRLLDTNIISFQMKNSPLFSLCEPHLSGCLLAIPFQTQAEVQEGAEMAKWGMVRRAALRALLNDFLVLHSDESVCQKYAEIRAARKHCTIPMADAWIAATALAHDLELVTHNPADFVEIPGLKLITKVK